mgnify:CR=1 FL=1
MEELGKGKIPMILATQYFFSVLRKDQETMDAVAEKIVELPKEDLFEFINYFCVNLTQMFEGICGQHPKVRKVMEYAYMSYRKEETPIA